MVTRSFFRQPARTPAARRAAILAWACFLAGGCLPFGQSLPGELPLGEDGRRPGVDRPATADDLPQWRRWPGARTEGSGGKTRADARTLHPVDVERRLLGNRFGDAGEVIEKTVAWRSTPRTEDAGPFRWQHAGLAEEMAFSDDPRQSLATALASENPIVRHTATIGLGRIDPGTRNDALFAVADDRLLPTSIRRAAIETLAVAVEPSPEPLLDRLLDKYGRPDVEPASFAGPSIYSPELHVELLRGLASRGINPGSDERFMAALSSPSELVQLAVLDLWQQYEGNSHDVPAPREFAALVDPSRPTAVRLRALRLWSEHPSVHFSSVVVPLIDSSDPTIRMAAIRAAVAHRHPAALDALRQTAGQYDLTAKLQAIELLGQLGGPEAQTLLHERMQNEKERARRAIVTALAGTGDWPSVLAAADDQKWQVRRAVAAALAEDASIEARQAARTLIADSSGEVRLAMVRSLDGWPLDAAGPLLLAAADSPDYRVRTEAATQLKRRWEPARDLPVHGSTPTAQADTVARLRRAWEQQFGPIDQTARDAAVASKPLPIPQEQRARIDRLLARWDPASPNEALRSSGDWKTALDEGRTARSPLPRPLVDAAIVHPSPMVRRAACEYFAARGISTDATALVPLLDDADTSVVLGAIDAVGRIGSTGQIEPLKRVLGHSDGQLRASAAGALARLGSPSGAAALERLALDRDKRVRRAAAIQMGRLEDPTCTATLIRLLDDERAVQSAAIESLVAVVGRDVAAEPGAPAAGVDEKSRRWKAWHAKGATAWKR